MPATKEHSMTSATNQRLPFVRLALLSAAAVVLHGYHLGVEDAEIYIPAAKKLLNPRLYPFATEFFLSHERLSLFAPILACSARLTHLSMDATIFLWYIATLFATFAACWMLAALGFCSARARWCAVLTIAAVLTMPAANTALLLMDPYLTARSFSTPLSVFALAALLARRRAAAVLLIALTASIHPQMAACLVFLMAILWLAEQSASSAPRKLPALAVLFTALPGGFRFGPATEPYREALYSRDYFFLSSWTWYDWLGLLAPLAFLLWFWKGNLRGTTPAFARLSFALIPFGGVSVLAAIIFSRSHNFDMFVRLQPLRCFHLITLVFILFLAGVIGEYAAKDRLWVIPALCLPLAAGMFCVARQTYPFSPQIEFPGCTTSPNAWVNTLLWIRQNTPTNAVFAVDSHYFKELGVDVHGFRAISERSDLADYFKDSGVVSLFPGLAVEWKQMSNATYGLDHFRRQDFLRLARQYPVTWAVIHGAAPSGMDCPYQQRGYSVCKIPDAPGLSAMSSTAGAQ
jgi:hypothetical protein